MKPLVIDDFPTDKKLQVLYTPSLQSQFHESFPPFYYQYVAVKAHFTNLRCSSHNDDNRVSRPLLRQIVFQAVTWNIDYAKGHQNITV